jgi:hypothetical protein
MRQPILINQITQRIETFNSIREKGHDVLTYTASEFFIQLKKEFDPQVYSDVITRAYAVKYKIPAIANLKMKDEPILRKFYEDNREKISDFSLEVFNTYLNSFIKTLKKCNIHLPRSVYQDIMYGMRSDTSSPRDNALRNVLMTYRADRKFSEAEGETEHRSDAAGCDLVKLTESDLNELARYVEGIQILAIAKCRNISECEECIANKEKFANVIKNADLSHQYVKYEANSDVSLTDSIFLHVYPTVKVYDRITKNNPIHSDLRLVVPMVLPYITHGI